ncbi:MAG: FKBP-type peptidyl-prolyl cis-trans isomerase [Nitrospirae bacterium]|nr:FKBP-type peptidyl-prolyl cis-trans isomerase [Nitrospirota bacterium]
MKGEEMKFLWSMLLGVVLLASQAGAEEKKAFQTPREKQSYSIGADIGNKLKSQSIDVDPDALAQGLKDAISGNKLLMTEQEIKESLSSLQKEMMEKQAERTKQLSEKNKKEGDAFLAENKKKEGVKTLPSGLQYKVITEGTGKTPKAEDTVITNYRGTLIDGTEFDSSYKRGQPATFPVKGVIPGWTEALQLMKEGSKWELFIPASLAYGERGAGNLIGPYTTLIFEIELISVK